MREIKFRAWEKERKQMVDLFKITPLALDPDLEVDGLFIPFDDRYKLMQYTGLKDKNGKEVYEGDIVLIPSYYKEIILDDGSGPRYDEPQICDVEMLEGCWGVKIDNPDELFDRGFYSFLKIKNDITDDPIEIIGNIYENKDLLK